MAEESRASLLWQQANAAEHAEVGECFVLYNKARIDIRAQNKDTRAWIKITFPTETIRAMLDDIERSPDGNIWVVPAEELLDG